MLALSLQTEFSPLSMPCIFLLIVGPDVSGQRNSDKPAFMYLAAVFTFAVDVVSKAKISFHVLVFVSPVVLGLP